MVGYNQQYKQLVEKVIKEGTYSECRNGEQVIIPFASFTINAKDWRMNLRKMYYGGVKAEWDTLMDPKPLTNVKQFKDRGCNYWDMFADDDGSINLDYHNKLHPQLEEVIAEMKVDPSSRRLIIELWDHESAQRGNLSLPCCWHGIVFTVVNKVINITWTQRSADLMLGVPADVYLAALFMQHASEETGFAKGTMSFALSNVHIYADHINNAKELLTRSEEDFDKPLKFKLL